MEDLVTRNKRAELEKRLTLAVDTLELMCKGFATMNKDGSYIYTDEYCRYIAVLSEARKQYLIAQQELNRFEEENKDD
mgnify:FL=1